MNSYQRLHELFDKAYDLPPDQVEAFLRQHAPDDPELIERVLNYLKASPVQAEPDNHLGLSGDEGAAGQATMLRLRQLRSKMHSGAPDDSRDDHTIGPYRIIQRIGEGGMGAVFLAEQREPVQRRVALKVVRAGRESKALLGRFERERQSLAMMNHPNIGKVLDAGSTTDGRPYFVMELVLGEPISQYCDKQRLTVEQRLRLFLQICHGVQHAHHKGVIHRDLKPDNILVEILDEHPVARIIDFGLARAANPMDLQHSVHTEFGQIIGTLPYMSPEQAEMSGTDIDTRTDIYSLGVLLYELLTGTLPFSDRELRSVGIEAFQRRIREDEPARPSRRVASSAGTASELGQQRRLSDIALVRRLRNDLDWIVMKCLEKDRARRYQTPSELAADIERHLAGESVLAGRPTTVYRIRRSLRRHRVLVGVLVTVFVTMGAALASVVAARNSEARQRQALELALAELSERMALAQADGLLTQGRRLLPLTWNLRNEATGWVPESRALIERVANAPRHNIDDPDRLAAQAVVRSRLDAAVAELKTTTASIAQQISLLVQLDGLHAGRWPMVVEGLRNDPRFDGLEIERWTGLVPLGPDPVTRFQEFAVALTGTIPARGPGDVLILAEDAAIVLVLLPGGTVKVGVIDDEEALPLEAAAGQVMLDPFLIAKHELTRDQWLRMANTSPNRFTEVNGPPQMMNGRSPVEQVPWSDAQATLGRYGLALPTEVQWEYAARGGTASRWWTGANRDSLLVSGPAENIADASATAARVPASEAREWPEYDDGFPLHGPVGSLLPNPFGLFDVLGNVKELCADPWIEYCDRFPPRSGDGLRETRKTGSRACRGGSWFNGISQARVTARRSVGESQVFDNVGIRAVRAIRDTR